MKEEWRPIDGFEGYMVSNLGNVKSLDRKVYCRKSGHYRTCKGMPIKPLEDKDGYYRVNLYNETGMYGRLIHRLVALAFIPNPNNLPIINHKDENRKNNIVQIENGKIVQSNLEWCTVEYNDNYGTRNAKMAKTLSDRKSKPFVQLTLKGEFVKRWAKAKDAEKEGFNTGCMHWCSQKHPQHHSHKGFIFVYESEYLSGNIQLNW